MTAKAHALSKPLAEFLRPSLLSEVIGQTHLLGVGKPLRLAFEMGKAFDCEWIALSAVFSGIKEIRAAMDLAARHQALNRHTMLFIDEIHRFNKAQQDALLPYTESGLVTLIGATTENPSFEVNSALLSRAQIYVLHALSDAELKQLLQRARAFVKKDKSREVPMHLRNAPTALMKTLAHNYHYAHDEPHGFAAGVNYLPLGIQKPGWYKPVDRGFEQKISQKMDFLMALDAKARKEGLA